MVAPLDILVSMCSGSEGFPSIEDKTKQCRMIDLTVTPLMCLLVYLRIIVPSVRSYSPQWRNIEPPTPCTRRR